jgi:hypothetical protein
MDELSTLANHELFVISEQGVSEPRDHENAGI